MKIAIIGGGISGLTTYLQLQKRFSEHPHLKDSLEITIFESHDLKKYDYDTQQAGVPDVGGGYGLAANGMSSLRRLHPNIHDRVLKNSFPTPRFRMQTRQGWTLGAVNCVIDDARGRPETCCMVTREVVLEALYGKVPSSVFNIRRVAEIVDGEDEAIVRFDGGEEAVSWLAQMVSGVARGRRSLVMRTGRSTGLSTLGGFVETKYLKPISSTGPMPYPQSQTVMTFGPNGFVGYSPCTTAKDVEITPDHIRGRAAVPRGDLTMCILEHTVKMSLIPTYALSKQKTWAGKRVVLVGDAAHALPSSSDQGVSQSVEDAEALALLLAHNLRESEKVSPPTRSEALQKTFQQYMTVRKAHVERVLDAGNRGGDASRDMNIVVEYSMYAFFWVMLKLFSRLFTKEIEHYHVVKEVQRVLR